MYETQTFETIMDRCLSRVSSSVDKREGSVIYDALAPACAELATLYTELSNMNCYFFLFLDDFLNSSATYRRIAR